MNMIVEDWLDVDSWPSHVEQSYIDSLEAQAEAEFEAKFEQDLIRFLRTDVWLYESIESFMEDPLFGLLDGDGRVYEAGSYDSDGNLTYLRVFVYHELMYMGNTLGTCYVTLHDDYVRDEFHVSAEFYWDAV